MNSRQIEHFAKINLARERMLEFAKSIGAPLFTVAFVATFEQWDKGIEAWFFYQTDDQISECEVNGASRLLTDFFKKTLIDLDYSFDAFPELIFNFDSKQNVDANYKGSIFFRLR